MAPGTTPPRDQRVRLTEIYVPPAMADKLAAVVAASGASGAWHRRAALAAYLERFDDEGNARG